MGEPLSAVSAFMSGASFVKDVLKIWDDIEKQIHNERATTKLATQLEDFGLRNRRDDVEIHLEIAQSIVSDRALASERKDRLVHEFNSLHQLLHDLPAAVAAVLREAPPEPDKKSGFKFRRHVKGALMPARSAAHSPSPHQVLEEKLAAFRKALDEFNRLTMTLRQITKPGNPMLLTTDDLNFIGNRSKINWAITLTMANYIQPGGGKNVTAPVVVESTPYTENTGSDIERGVRTLAAKLRLALSAEFIPRLLGYRISTDDKVIDLVFERPLPDRELVSLSRLYADGTPKPSLNMRVLLCRQLAVAVLQAHTLGLVHKDIRPQNLVVAVRRDDEHLIDATLFLCGWQRSRVISGVASKMLGESALDKVMYQHPDRHALDGNARRDYTIDHDIYSLGVCALELLTWDVLVRPGARDLDPVVPSDAYVDMYKKLGYAADQAVEADSDSDDSGDARPVAVLFAGDQAHVQKTLVNMAKLYAPREAGERLGKLVYRCLDPKPIVEDANDVQISDNIESEILADLDKVLSAL